MKSHCTDRAEFMNMIQEAWDEYPMETLDGIWGCLYNNYHSIMACDGGNQYKHGQFGQSESERRRLQSNLRNVKSLVNILNYIQIFPKVN